MPQFGMGSGSHRGASRKDKGAFRWFIEAEPPICRAVLLSCWPYVTVRCGQCSADDMSAAEYDSVPASPQRPLSGSLSQVMICASTEIYV